MHPRLAASKFLRWTALIALAAVGGGCGKGSGVAQEAKVAAPAPAAKPAPAPAPVMETDGADHKDLVPAGVKTNGARWKDTGVYVDGKPVGNLSFGDLPITLQPVWREDEISAPKKPGSKDPGYRIVKQRFYRFTDYLTAVGVDLKKVKEVHVYGPKLSNSIVVSGAELRKKGNGFLFHFGGEVWGKALPLVPDDFGNGKTPDKVAAVLVYIDKKPPRHIPNEGMELDGELVDDIPYFGEPMRGGVRIYFDDKLAAVVKRRLLADPKLSETAADGSVHWKLLPFLAAQGVDTSKIVEGWVVRGERRREKLTRAQLEHATFISSEQARGEILIGDEKLPAQVLALHSREIQLAELPQVLPDEETGAADEQYEATRVERAKQAKAAQAKPPAVTGAKIYDQP